MNAIIPVASSIARKRAFGAISPYVPALRRQAFTAMGYAARYAARRIQRRWRRYYRTRTMAPYKRRRVSYKKQHFSRRQIGERPGSNTTKRFTVLDQSPTILNTRTLYKHELTEIPRAATNEIDSRMRDILNIRGFKLYMHFDSAASTPRPTTVNVAVISPKDGVLDVSDVGFFRGTGLTRGLDFDPTILNSLDFNTRHINTDKYIILWHKRFLMAERNSGAAARTNKQNSYVMIKKWVGLKRQVRYDGIPEGPPGARTGPVWLVYWIDKYQTAAGPGIPDGSLACRAVTYFREPRP